MTIPLEILRTILLHNGVDGRTLAGVTADLERWQQAQDEDEAVAHSAAAASATAVTNTPIVPEGTPGTSP